MSNKEYLFTIMTPCCNHEKYLDDYFRGLLSQTYTNIELIIVDDASEDDSWKKVCMQESALKKKFPRVILERNSKNMGLLAVLDLMKNLATGDYMSILESDDYLKSDKVEENVRYLVSHPEFGCVHSDIDFCFEDHIESSHWATLRRSFPEGKVFNRLLFENFILTCSFCCRGNLFQEHVDFQKYASQNYLTADYPMFLDLARHTNFGYIQKSLAVYRIVKDSISHPSDLRKQFLWRKSYYQVKLDYIQEYDAPLEVIERARRQYYLNFYEFGYKTFQREEFTRGYQWLQINGGKEFRRWPHCLRAMSMKNRVLWKAISLFDTFEISRLFSSQN